MLLTKLIERQKTLGLNDFEFAALLHVPRSTWQLTRTGRKRIGPTIARAAMRTFPDMTPEAVSFLLSDATAGTKPSPTGNHLEALSA